MCRKHSAATETGSRNMRPIQVGVASVSSYRTNLAAMELSPSCCCSQLRKKPAKICQIGTNSNHSNGCQACAKKQSSTSSFCRESLLRQVRSYLRKLTSSHKISCQRCNQNASSACKVSLLEQGRDYLISLFTDHKRGCQRCKQRETASYLETILETAWSYIQKIGSDHKIRCQQRVKCSTSDSVSECCECCLRLGLRVCCKHSSPKDVRKSCQRCKPKIKPVCCKSDSSQNQGILKQLSSNSTYGSCGKDSLQEYANKLVSRADEVFRDYKSCPKLCLEKLSLESIHPVRLCRSTEEHKKSCHVPCCKHSSQGAQRNASPHGSCCSFQSSVKLRKTPSCTGGCAKPSQSGEKLQEGPSNKHSSQTTGGRDFLGYHSSTRSGGPCQKDDSDKPKQCPSLTKNSKHSVPSNPSQSVGSCVPPSSIGACPSNVQEKAEHVNSSSCAGGCSKGTSQYAYQKKHMVDAQYEAFLDDRFGRMVAQQLFDKETLYRNGCDCMTSIDCIQCTKPESSGNACR